MPIYSVSPSSSISEDTQIWDNLKEAIAASSGFQSWEIEHRQVEDYEDNSLDYRVRRYLRETLETLAY